MQGPCFELGEGLAESAGVVEPGLVALGLLGVRVRVTVLPATVRVQCRYGPWRTGGSALHRQFALPQRIRRLASVPGSA